MGKLSDISKKRREESPAYGRTDLFKKRGEESQGMELGETKASYEEVKSMSIPTAESAREISLTGIDKQLFPGLTSIAIEGGSMKGPLAVKKAIEDARRLINYEISLHNENIDKAWMKYKIAKKTGQVAYRPKTPNVRFSIKEYEGRLKDLPKSKQEEINKANRDFFDNWEKDYIEKFGKEYTPEKPEKTTVQEALARNRELYKARTGKDLLEEYKENTLSNLGKMSDEIAQKIETGGQSAEGRAELAKIQKSITALIQLVKKREPESVSKVFDTEKMQAFIERVEKFFKPEVEQPSLVERDKYGRVIRPKR
jgi:hypothetical protein